MNENFQLKQKPEEKKETEYFTVVGDQDYFDNSGSPRLNEDNPKVLAKRICYYDNDDNLIVAKTRYMIKVGSYGRIYNPIGMYSEGRSNYFMKKSGKEEWRMKEVNENIFNLYLSFLKTKNTGHLTLAERGLQ
jgi:hypothetical protein